MDPDTSTASTVVAGGRWPSIGSPVASSSTTRCTRASVSGRTDVRSSQTFRESDTPEV
jgi:hypothetical protein